MKQILILAAIAATFGITSACSSATETTKTNQTTATTNANVANTAVAATANSTTANAPATNANAADEAPPESVKAAFTDANSYKKEHKNMTPAQLAEIEKTAGVKPPDTDHHYFAAFSGGSGGGRKQIGAATTVKAGDNEMVVVYENKEGKPFIKEVRADGVPAAFLSQFVGKSHDDKMQIGADIKANGVDDKTAKAIADAVRVDAVTMQILYGAKDSH